jgi:predicted permease
VVGRALTIGGVSHEVIGVMPAAFDVTADSEELWVPIAFTPERRRMHDEHMLRVNGRLRPGVTTAQAFADLARVAESLLRDHPRENQERGVAVRPFAEVTVGVYRERLWLLLGAVFLVLLIACANVASLLLARGAARARELAVRAALGAGRFRLVRQMLTESLLLGAVGALFGLAVARGAVALILRGSPPGVPRLEQVAVNGPVLAFTAGLALFTSVVFGLVPALRASRQDVRGDLGAGGRGTVAGGARDRLRRALVAAEVALCLVLLAGAGLLIRSALKLQDVDPGFDPTGVLSARVTLPASAYPGHERPARAFEHLVERLAHAPGVAAATVSSQAPLVPGGSSNGLVPEGRAVDLKSAIDATRYVVGDGYFHALRIPIRRGRAFTAEDRRGAPRVMIVNETLARAAWPAEDPIGKRIACCEGTPEQPSWKTVVGVAGDVRSRGPGVEVRPEFYLPLDQVPEVAWDWSQRTMVVVVRAEAMAPESLTTLMRQAVREMDPTVPVFNVATMPERLRTTTAQARFNTALLTALGAVGLVLAAVGIYGVIAYFVAQRTREIGVRMALGATARDVMGLVLRQGLAAVAAGIVVGLPTAVVAGRALEAMLFGVGSADPLTLATVVSVLLLVALVASVAPARRAVRVQPTEALAES